MNAIIFNIAILLLTVIIDVADEPKKNCYPITGKELIRADAPKFTDYPAAVKMLAKPAKVKLNSPAARNWRTVLREGANKGPRFAGHYAIATWGCGSGCMEFALVDLLSGKVIFPEGIIPVTYSHLIDADDFEKAADAGMIRCRNDSRLLIVVGSIENEFPGKDCTGAFYYVLENEKLKKVFETKIRKDDCFSE